MPLTDGKRITIVFVSNDEMIIKVVISVMQFAPGKITGKREESVRLSWRPNFLNTVLF